MDFSSPIAEAYVSDLIRDETDFKAKSLSVLGLLNGETQKKRVVKNILFILKSLISSLIFFVQIYLNPEKFKNKRFVFTAINFCKNVDGKLVDRVIKPLNLKDIVYINSSKQYYIDRIDGLPVVNTGGLIKIFGLFSKSSKSYLRMVWASKIVNDIFLRKLSGNEIYILWFYDMNSLGIVFSRYRDRIKLIEVQHGSIINYPPYQKPSPIRIADKYYVKNQKTINYLKSHLNRDFSCEYGMIPYPKVERENKPGINILYASTIEFHGFHPVMKKYLNECEIGEIELTVRLHPREVGKEDLFLGKISNTNLTFDFDRSENWLEYHKVSNLIVVSPWSSMIEDAYDNGFKVIIIDPVGKERYAHLLDDVKCFYSEDLHSFLATRKI